MPHVVTIGGLDHPVVVLIGDVPHLARLLTAEDAHGFGIAIGDAGEQETGVAPACAKREMPALDQDCAYAAPGEVVEEAGTRDPPADDEDVGAVGQLTRVSLRGPRPES
jgi:hypothetical protein